MTVKYEKNTIEINERKIELEHTISDVWCQGQCFFVLFARDETIQKWGQFPNLICINDCGSKLWTAELPTTDTGDRYYKIVSIDPLRAYSVKSFSCVIDEKTGKILSKEFFK